MSVRARIATVLGSAAALSVSVGGNAAAKEPAPTPEPLMDPELRRRAAGTPTPFGGGYGWGTSGPIVAKRYSKPESAWTRDEIAAHAKSERRRLRDMVKP